MRIAWKMNGIHLWTAPHARPLSHSMEDIEALIFHILGTLARSTLISLWLYFGVFEGKVIKSCWKVNKIPTKLSVHLALQHLSDWKQICGKIPSLRVHQSLITNNSKNNTWIPPSTPYMKCNIDATLFKSTNSFGISACMRDSNGVYIAARTQSYQGDPTPQEVEAVALLTALLPIFVLHLNNIIVEMDCN